jgi:hypothetical protein
MKRFNHLLVAVGIAIFSPLTVFAQQNFATLVGPVTVAPVAKSDVLQVPYITWGGDAATFHANGGLTTQPGTIFAKEKLNLKLTSGDDFRSEERV